MRTPFDRLNRNDSMAIKRYLGDYVSHDVVRDWRKQYYFTVEELNEMDRKELATTWYNSDVWKKKRWDALISSFYGGDVEAFLDEVARYIDDRIPRAYQKYHAEGHTPSGNSIECNKDGNPIFGLIYHYSENKAPQAFVLGATNRQISYLTDLAAKKDLQLCSEGMSKDEASECIGYFLNMSVKPAPTCFQKYFKARAEDTLEDGSQKKAKRGNDLTDKQMEKIEWFAEREGKYIASMFQSICEAVQSTDFSKTEHQSIHEARELIIAIVESQGMQWDKADSCEDCYHIEGGLKIGRKSHSYSIGVNIDYYDIPIEEIWKKMPAMVVEQFGAMTPEKVTNIIKKQLISSMKRKRHAGRSQINS